MSKPHCTRYWFKILVSKPQNYAYGSIRMTFFRFAESNTVDFRKFRFRFVLFLVRIWLEKALFLTIFPEPLVLKRLAAPRLVFIFGIILLHS